MRLLDGETVVLDTRNKRIREISLSDRVECLFFSFWHSQGGRREQRRMTTDLAITSSSSFSCCLVTKLFPTHTRSDGRTDGRACRCRQRRAITHADPSNLYFLILLHLFTILKMNEAFFFLLFRTRSEQWPSLSYLERNVLRFDEQWTFLVYQERLWRRSDW